ncbi:MAG: TlyA family RNA methyltransferase [Candidatus Aminicenantes bacterium]|nr:TlyA family RNA methyltransferase [Candidatus Aminicenantes bacterium]
MTKERLDKVLVERRLAETRQKAQALIMAGLVFGDGRRLEKAGQLVPAGLDITVQKTLPYVGRGGLKLEEALAVFKVGVAGRTCADIGSSTGGFTDCLLQRGAARVYAVDVDTRQIDRKLREDPRVVLIEKNARYLAPGDFPELPDLFTIDVSFISVIKILPAIKGVMETARHPFILSLIKPQFEAGKGRVGRTGVVRDAGVHVDVLRRVLREAADIGFDPRGLVRCSTRGQKGNQEFFVLWSSEGLQPPWDAVLQWIEEVTRDEHHS